jgi:2-amino-4-hydroxy-6-hydroxymethyldihydropteridine diphosphokinase
MIRCYLGLGSNLASPRRQLKQALLHLRQLPRTVLSDISPLYHSKPWGFYAQPAYVNLVVAVDTKLPAQQLLRHCQMIEQKQGRLRKKKWGPRTLDIDILLYGEKTISTPLLRLPHPWILWRDFVVQPLLQIAPQVRLPTGEKIADLILTT